MLKAIMLTPNLSIGGAERWVASMIRYADPTRIKWCGVVVSGWGGLDPSLCAEITEHCPIYSERKIEKTMRKNKPTPAAVSPDCERFVTRCRSLPHAIQAAGLTADVLVAWGSIRYVQFLNKHVGPQEMVLVSHSSHHKPEKIGQYPFKIHLAAVSEMAKQQFDPQHGQPIEVIYNGAQIDRLKTVIGRDRQRKAWGVEDQYVIGYIGRRSAEKNPAAAAMAMQKLSHQRWRAIYYGNMPIGQRHPGLTEKKVMEWAATMDPVIQMHDPVQDIGDVYAGIDVLMLASHSEAFSLTLLEAFYTGVPVVATPVGSVPELTKKFGKVVIEVPCNPTSAQLADACRRAVSTEGMKIASRAKQIAREHFTAEKMAERWADYLERVVTKRTIRRVVLDL